ncbi:MAG: hypothetical protein JSU74_04040, partial [Candidatus Zixiibacteriota bacterium]
SGLIYSYPGGMTSAILAADYYLNDKIEIVVVGKGEMRDKMLAELHRRYLPNVVIASEGSDGRHPALFDGRLPHDGRVRAFVCRNSVCELPVSTLDELKQQLNDI